MALDLALPLPLGLRENEPPLPLRLTPDRHPLGGRDGLGRRLGDHSGDGIAFMHALHGSDHHVRAFAKSDQPGLHPSSRDVRSVDEVGCGVEQMRNTGHADGWGVGRHVLGSNDFCFVRDPRKRWAEDSFDIDFVLADLDWKAADHPAEDSIHARGPTMHPESIVDHEAPVA